MADRPGRRWFNSIPGLCGLVVGAGLIFQALRLSSESWAILITAGALGTWCYAALGAPGSAEARRAEWQVFGFSGISFLLVSLGALCLDERGAPLTVGLDSLFPHVVQFDQSDEELLSDDLYDYQRETFLADQRSVRRWHSGQHQRFLAIGYTLASLGFGVLTVLVARALKARRVAAIEGQDSREGQ